MNDRSTRVERRFAGPITVATLLVIPVMIVQASADDGIWETIGWIGDSVIWLTFLAEVVAMLWVVPDRRAWLRGHVLDVAIVVLTPPLSPDALKSLRILRLLRIVRLVRVAALLRGVFTIQGVQYAAFLAVVTLIAGAEAFRSIEPDQTTGHGLYWAIGTMTTAGSDPIKATDGTTQAIGAALMVIGLAFAAILTGAIAQRIITTEDTVTEGDIETHERQDATHAKLDSLAVRLDRIEAALSGDYPQSRLPSHSP